MGCDLPQLLLLIRGQIRFDVLGVTTNQVNAAGNYNVQVDDPGAAALSFALRRLSQFPNAARSRYHVAGVGMVDQINSQCLDTIRPDHLGGLSLELWQLQDRDLGRIVHRSRVYRNAV
jgi:hypothetical protein